MLTVRELRALAEKLSEPYFCRKIGPFALVRTPPRPVVEEMAPRLGVPRTALGNGSGGLDALQASVLLSFDLLQVATLPPLRSQDALAVGRLPSCELVINDPSVSKQHAELRWHAPVSTCCVKDLQSTGGTSVNGQSLTPSQEYILRDGDLLRFGEVDFAFFVTKSLHARLTRGSPLPVASEAGG
jgi:pSer/pThr/pTyr-binding forkhead associated (FHA) protein